MTHLMLRTLRALPFGRRFEVLLGEGGRYLLISVAALGIDYSLLIALHELAHIPTLTASAISYTTGAVAQYLLSVWFVFANRRVSDWRLEFIAFFGIGLLGLALTQLVLSVSVALGISYVAGKAVATGVSFVANFIARRTLLFTKPQAPA